MPELLKLSSPPKSETRSSLLTIHTYSRDDEDEDKDEYADALPPTSPMWLFRSDPSLERSG